MKINNVYYCSFLFVILITTFTYASMKKIKETTKAQTKSIIYFTDEDNVVDVFVNDNKVDRTTNEKVNNKKQHELQLNANEGDTITITAAKNKGNNNKKNIMFKLQYVNSPVRDETYALDNGEWRTESQQNENNVIEKIDFSIPSKNGGNAGGSGKQPGSTISSNPNVNPTKNHDPKTPGFQFISNNQPGASGTNNGNNGNSGNSGSQGGNNPNLLPGNGNNQQSAGSGTNNGDNGKSGIQGGNNSNQQQSGITNNQKQNNQQFAASGTINGNNGKSGSQGGNNVNQQQPGSTNNQKQNNQGNNQPGANNGNQGQGGNNPNQQSGNANNQSNQDKKINSNNSQNSQNQNGNQQNTNNNVNNQNNKQNQQNGQNTNNNGNNANAKNSNTNHQNVEAYKEWNCDNPTEEKVIFRVLPMEKGENVVQCLSNDGRSCIYSATPELCRSIVDEHLAQKKITFICGEQACKNTQKKYSPMQPREKIKNKLIEKLNQAKQKAEQQIPEWIKNILEDAFLKADSKTNKKFKKL